MMDKTAYYQPDHYQREAEQLFDRGWHFVGLKREFDRNKAFVSMQVGNHDVVVQNFNGELRAFSNVCTHRFNRLQWDSRGERALSCRYHSWTYNKDGIPVGVERQPQFEGCNRDHLTLRRFELDQAGDFVFVRLGGTTSLAEQLGEYHGVLRTMSDYIGPEIGYAEVEHRANWKLLVENVVECYHCGTVHPQTFTPLGIGRRPLEEVHVDGGNSASHFPRVAPPREHLRQRFLSHLKTRAFSHDSFYHIFVFPNLFITSSEGLSFYVGHALPRAADQTTLRMRFFDPAVELDAKGEERQQGIRQEVLKTSLALVEEDRAVLEQIQAGVARATSPGVLGGEEVRIRAFHDFYARAMSPVDHPFRRLAGVA